MLDLLWSSSLWCCLLMLLCPGMLGLILLRLWPLCPGYMLNLYFWARIFQVAVDLWDILDTLWLVTLCHLLVLFRLCLSLCFGIFAIVHWIWWRIILELGIGTWFWVRSVALFYHTSVLCLLDHSSLWRPLLSLFWNCSSAFLSGWFILVLPRFGFLHSLLSLGFFCVDLWSYLSLSVFGSFWTWVGGLDYNLSWWGLFFGFIICLLVTLIAISFIVLCLFCLLLGDYCLV